MCPNMQLKLGSTLKILITFVARLWYFRWIRLRTTFLTLFWQFSFVSTSSPAEEKNKFFFDKLYRRQIDYSHSSNLFEVFFFSSSSSSSSFFLSICCIGLSVFVSLSLVLNEMIHITTRHYDSKVNDFSYPNPLSKIPK